MNKDFKDYKFSINTEIMWYGNWYKVKEVDFENEVVKISISDKDFLIAAPFIQDIK
jgi:hypothetical protein